MLKVQEYLRSGKTLKDLEVELGIEHVLHPTDSRVILNYSQINSPKAHPIVRECRALVLRQDNFDLVARSFNRFPNWGEFGFSEASDFNFEKCRAFDKEDGSLINLYYFEGAWHINTRGSFGQGLVGKSQLTWEELFLKALGLPDKFAFDLYLHRDRSYALELTTLFNKVVRMYSEPCVYLLAQFQGEEELPDSESDLTAPLIGARRPFSYEFSSISEVISHVTGRGAVEATYEGVVIKDDQNVRFKVKNPRYLALHKLRGEGQDPFTPKNLISFILDNEGDELLTYYPEAREIYDGTKATIEEAFASLTKVWHENHKIESQKEFAQTIIPQTKFSGLLFILRKNRGKDQTLKDLEALWRESGDLILKVLF